jgi:hypothetical protein
VIYLDSSVVLARLLDEPRSPPDSFWSADLLSSRLLEYEVLNRILSRPEWAARADRARMLTGRLKLIDMRPDVLSRALSPFPVPVRTLDGLHLATMDFLRVHGQTFELATYDGRLAAAAQALGFALAPV